MGQRGWLFSIDSRGRIAWTPKGSDLSSPVAIAITVTDSQGATAIQTFNLSAIADTTNPLVTVQATRTSLNVGESVTYQVRGTDNVGVTGLILEINGQAVALDSQGRATVQHDVAQALNVQGYAVDGAGNRGA
jgi:hypothetical protein